MNKSAIFELFSQFQPQSKPLTEMTASVMVLLVEKESTLYLLMTKRPESIATYAGDYCFPGGMNEKNDRDLRHTAERELEEELNLRSSDYLFISQLNATQDRYGNLVRPFLAYISNETFENNYRVAQDEIESIYLLPLEAIKEFERDVLLEQKFGRAPLYSYRHDNVFIWGLTARIIVELRDSIF